MSIPLSVNGQVFNYPVVFDENWGIEATGWAQAVTNGMLQRSGGNFPLTADVDFGASFGLKAAYFETRIANPATSGLVRLSKTDTVEWRNNANSADNILAVDSSDHLTFNGSTIGTGGNVSSGTQYQLAYYPASTNSVSGLTLITPSQALQSDANGLPVASGVSSTTLAFLDATSSVQTQLNSISTVANAALPKAGGTMSGNLDMGSNRIQNVANGVNPTDAANVSQVNSSAPSGQVAMFAGTAAPTGWLLCDGTSYAAVTYPTLFAVIAYMYGGAGANFNVPDLTNRVPVGPGSIAALAATAGSATHTLAQSELPVALGTATSTVTDPGHVHNEEGVPGAAGGTPITPSLIGYVTGSPIGTAVNTASATTGITVGTTITNSSGGNAHSIVQPVIGLNFIIKI